MLHTSYKLKDNYRSVLRQNEQKPDFFTLKFYRINTRERVIIESSKEVAGFFKIPRWDEEPFRNSQRVRYRILSLVNFTTFLLDRDLITVVKNESPNPRFLRQIAFFDDLLLQQDGAVSQEILKNKKVVLFGLGSVGSSIAILLARMGIGNFVFIDYKKLDDSHIISISIRLKPIAVNTNMGLKRIFQKIYSQLTIKCFNEKIVPLSALEDYIPSDTAMISSADELYIRHASIKIGRYAWTRNIPMYVAGGFDAHSISTGEMIVPHVTSCIDCYKIEIL